MRQFNERVVLQAIRLQGSCPKAELARLTGLTAQTVGLITARLEEDGLLKRHEPVRGRIGQPSVPLALAPDGAFSIGIKVGRRSMDCLLVDFVGHVRQRTVLEYDIPDENALLPAIAEKIQHMRQQLGPLQSRLVGVGVAAPFNMGGWHLLQGLPASTADYWNRLDVAAAVQSVTDLPVSHARDTLAACVAELVSGRGREIKSFLYLYVDTFVGGGLVLHSHLHRGMHGNAGAVASMALGEAQAGQPAPRQMLEHASLWDLEQRLRAAGLDPHAAYDERALQAPFNAITQVWLEQAANSLALCVVNGTAFLDVDAVVLDGAFSRPMLQALLAQTRSALQRYHWEGLWPVELVAGSVGSEAHALGGALLPLHANFAPDRDLFLK
ncbi:ROK family transcriptional regulator [Curvibacter sp. CHRR-16]|uniref:ROK family transcriptional regulator n=1 Tax=Curvibacter sp. CHRR-16 TaxID=2835872 RepID=UPI002023B574|nr:ROK family transcriptional regulator [Curvibacter sp. CHRR-16]